MSLYYPLKLAEILRKMLYRRAMIVHKACFDCWIVLFYATSIKREINYFVLNTIQLIEASKLF